MVPILGAAPRFDASLTTELKNVVSGLLAASSGLILHQDEGISRRLSEPAILRIRSLKPEIQMIYTWCSVPASVSVPGEARPYRFSTGITFR